MSKLGVIGAGTMGHGIAQVALSSGLEVALVDLSSEALERGVSRIGKGFDRWVAKGKVSQEDRDAAMGRLVASSDASAAADAHLVVEAVVERYDVKAAVLKQLDEVCSPETILATNTSSISITKLAAVTERPDRVIGMHFMNPVPLMKLIEVIRGLATSQETYDTVERLSREMGKTPVEVRDAPGFVSNRVLLPMINEAIFCLFEGVGEVEAIDEVMKLGMNHPMGPLALADLIGLDVCLDIMEVLHEGFRDSKYRACPLLVSMVDAGYLGRKSGRGFYDYQTTPPTPFRPRQS